MYKPSSLDMLGLYQYLEVSLTNFGVAWVASTESEWTKNTQEILVSIMPIFKLYAIKISPDFHAITKYIPATDDKLPLRESPK